MVSLSRFVFLSGEGTLLSFFFSDALGDSTDSFFFFGFSSSFIPVTFFLLGEDKFVDDADELSEDFANLVLGDPRVGDERDLLLVMLLTLPNKGDLVALAVGEEGVLLAACFSWGDA